MIFAPSSIYHVYNRGNNSQTIFITKANYQFFLKKIKKEICPLADILAYCLMPNHFHLLMVVNENYDTNKNQLPRKIGTLLSSYTRAINIQENRTGSLFQQKTKSIEITTDYVSDNNSEYLTTCFHYIHQNPLNAGLVDKLEEWEYSSFNAYKDNRDEKLINTSLAKETINVDWENFLKESYGAIDENFF